MPNKTCRSRRWDGWLTPPGSSKPALIIMSLWGAVGGNTMLIFLAGLQGISKELYESAEINDAGGWSKFHYITVPSLSPVILFNTVLGVIVVLQMFTLVYIATTGIQQQFSPGGPLYSTLFYVLHLYNSAFDYWEMGYASALGWLDTYNPLIVPHWLGGGAFAIFLFRQFL